MIKIVIFDLGGVVFNFSGGLEHIGTKYSIPLEKVNESFLKFDNEVCLGNISPQEFWEVFRNDLGIKQDKKIDYLDLWVSFFEPIKSTHRLIKDISDKHTIGILTNIYKGTYERSLGIYIPDIKYKIVVKSCDEHLVKPDTKIYKFTQKKLNINPGEILFVDDSVQNIKVAEKLGWKTSLFNTIKSKKSVLEIRKLLNY